MNKSEFASPAFAYQSNTLSQNILHQLESLTLGSKKCSDFETISQNGNKVSVQKTKQISRLRKKQVKGFDSRCSQASIMRKKNKMHKKMLQNRIVQLQKEISSLRRTCQRCPNCHPEILCHGMIPNDVQMVRKEQFLKIARELDHKNSSQSIQFQVLDFAQTLASKPQMDDQAWIMIGVMMIAMGSKNMEIDGTINTFKVLNDCVDSVRRQVQKSLPKIDLDFYFLKQQSGNFIQGLDFDPFYSKVQKGGFQLQGIKLENSEMFDLVYDDKVVFSINYDSLLASMAHLKQNCWVSSF